ncbi:MAG: PEP-CTERM sorting domain-containing protein [Candidatus Omnitrophota bacterium]
MMNKTIARVLNFAILAGSLPFIYGCGPGGSSAGIFGDSLAGVVGSGSVATGGGSIATIHNPEPATMLLLGSGLAAMAIYKRKKN